jgi:hypothetical protein
MPGTLVITTLSDGTNSTSATNCIQGSAKAWVLFNASTGVIASSYNVSSITSAGAGGIVNMTNAMPDTNYLVVTGTTDDSAWNNGSNVQGTTSNRTTSSFTVACWNRTGPGVGPSGLSVVVFR